MAKTKGNATAIYNSAGVTLTDGDETDLFVNSTGALLTSATIAANSSVNVSQINGVTPLMGAGNTGTGSLRVTIATDQANLTTPLNVASAASATGGYTYLNIAAGQATTIVKASAGTLHSIILNSAATATNTTVVYDHPSGAGTVIGRPAVTTATVPTTLIYDIAFLNGLTIITAVANGGDMTICYK